MRIDHIDLQNVMRFERWSANFTPQFNVIVGDNGSGKTSVLRMLAWVLSHWTPRAPQVIEPEFVRRTIEVAEGAAFLRHHAPWHIGVMGVDPTGIPFDGLEGTQSSPGMNLAFSTSQRAQRLHAQAEADANTPLPLLAYFSPWREKPRSNASRVGTSGVPSRLDGYTDALDLHADYDAFAGWFKDREIDRQETGETIPAAEAARRAVMGVIPGCRDLRWYRKLNDIVVTLEDGERHELWRLSDGYRTMLAMVGEMAWRAAVLNPRLGERVTDQVQGVVLIDELDLHLHPRWQRHVVDDLRRVFPKVQFITTTHSPFIVQSMRRDEVINLDEGASMDFWREGIEDIAQHVMGLNDEQMRRSQLFVRFEQLSEAYVRLLEAPSASPDEVQEKRRQLDRLQEQLSDNPATVAILRMERLAREGQQ